MKHFIDTAFAILFWIGFYCWLGVAWHLSHAIGYEEMTQQILLLLFVLVLLGGAVVAMIGTGALILCIEPYLKRRGLDNDLQYHSILYKLRLPTILRYITLLGLLRQLARVANHMRRMP